MTTKDDFRLAELIYIGDSDIARWPQHLLPKTEVSAVVHGECGATLADVAKTAAEIFAQVGADKIKIIVGCAGENDVAQSICVDTILDSFQKFVQSVQNGYGDNTHSNHLILFLGPKIEPWMKGDQASYKQYAKLARGLKRACEKQQDSLYFVDCLTMFCDPNTANIPGAVMGARAQADPSYFDYDKLHLSIRGYSVWQEVLQPLLKHAIAHGKWPLADFL